MGLTAVQKDKKTKEHIKLFFKDWMNNNIFLWKKWDSIAYFALFIIIPIAVTWISLSTLSSDNISKVYCYLTIFISSLNSLYDCANRWKEERSIHNTKIFLIILSNIVIAVYCTIVILYILITKNLNMRFDGIFFVYLIAVIITLFDIIACFAQEMAIRSYIKGGGE